MYSMRRRANARKYKHLALAENCAYCGAPFGGVDWLKKTVDHRLPRSRGGSDEPSNLSACCKLCNRTKGNMTAEEYVEWRRRGRPNKVAYMIEIGLIVGASQEACTTMPFQANEIKGIKGFLP